MNLKKQEKKGNLGFFRKSTAKLQILIKRLMLSVPFTVQYTHKNPVKFHFDLSNRFSVSNNQNFENIKGSRFLPLKT